MRRVAYGECDESTAASLTSARFVKPAVLHSMATRGQITDVIFEMDGLLLDTEKFYTQVQEIILARYDKTFDWSLKANMMGMKAIEAARVFVEATGISHKLSAEDFFWSRGRICSETCFPLASSGASRLIKHLHEKGVPICVATGSHKRHFELKTQRHTDLFSLMHHIVLGDDPKVKKESHHQTFFLQQLKDSRNVVMVPELKLDSSYYGAADQVISLLLQFNPSEWSLPEFESKEST